MKKRIVLCACIIGLAMNIGVVPSKVSALTPPLVDTSKPYYSADFTSTDDFVTWVKNGIYKTENGGVHAHHIDKFEKIGYVPVPYLDGNIIKKPAVKCDSLSVFQYKFNDEGFYVEADKLPDRLNEITDIASYVKDKYNLKSLTEEYNEEQKEPGDAPAKYVFEENSINIGGVETKCVLIDITVYSAYLPDIISSVKYNVVFMYNGTVINVVCDAADKESVVMNSLNKLKFDCIVINQENYNKDKTVTDTKTEVKDDTKTEIQDDTKKDVKKSSIKIKGKKKIKCDKSYKYKVSLKNISGKVKWSVNKRKIAKVTKNGKLKALKKGTVKLTAKCGKASCSIKIKIVK